MTSTWKADESHIGRTVVCIDNNCDYLTYGKEYKITGVSSEDFITVQDDDGDSTTFYSWRFKLKEEEKSLISNSPKLPDSFKIRINDPEHSALVQKWLFENGYEWDDGDDVVKFTDKKFLYVYEVKYIAYGDSESCFIEEQYQEVVFDMTVVPRVVEEEEQALQEVEIFGKKYVVKDKEMLENALKSAGIVEKEM